MTGFGDALKAAYNNEEARLRTQRRDPHRTVRAVRRRRVAHAAGTGSVAVVGVAAVGTVWWLAPGGRFAEPAVPTGSAGCEIWPYVPANAEAVGDASALFRVYSDLRPNVADPKVVVVLPDGTATRVEPNEAGDYTYTLDGFEHMIWSHEMPAELTTEPMVLNITDFGGGGDVWDGVSPSVSDYAWTVVVPEQVPAGIDTAWLSSTLRVNFGMGGMGYGSEAVPKGAVTDVTLTTTSGATETRRLQYGDTGPSAEGRDDVASIALTVSGLPDGERFTILATYDPSGIPAPTCASDHPPLVTATSSPEPTVVVDDPLLPGSSAEPSPTPWPTLEPSSGPSVGPSVGPSSDSSIREEPTRGVSMGPTPAP